MNKKNTAFTFIIVLIILSISEGVSYYLLNNILMKKDVVYKPVIEENSINGVTKEAYVERFKKYNSLMGNLLPVR